MPSKSIRKKRRKASEVAIEELAGVWCDETGETYEVQSDWTVVRLSGRNMRRRQLSWDTDETSHWFLWGETHYLNVLDIKGSRAYWYRMDDLSRKSKPWVWHRVDDTRSDSSEWPTSAGVVSQLSGIWLGMRGETYEVLASDWTVTREGGGRKTMTYELFWKSDDHSCWLQWGASFYMDPFDFRKSPNAPEWYRINDVAKNKPAWTWSRRKAVTMSTAAQVMEQPASGIDASTPSNLSKGDVLVDSDRDSWASDGVWQMNMHILRTYFVAWISIPSSLHKHSAEALAAQGGSSELVTRAASARRLRHYFAQWLCWYQSVSTNASHWLELVVRLLAARDRVMPGIRTRSVAADGQATLASLEAPVDSDKDSWASDGAWEMNRQALRSCFSIWKGSLLASELESSEFPSNETQSAPNPVSARAHRWNQFVRLLLNTRDSRVPELLLSVPIDSGALAFREEGDLAKCTAEVGSDVASTCANTGSECSSNGTLRTLQVPQARQQSHSFDESFADTLAQMNALLVARQPARAQLFQIVQAAVVDSFGRDFLRLALVGSAALGIDTPASDIDAVAFTREAGTPPISALSRVAAVMRQQNPSFRLELIDPPGAPALLVVWSPDGNLSMDLTVNQPLAERHVLWLSQQREFAAPIHQPEICVHELRFEATVIRCLKWWLRRRQMPTTKEGGYPTIVWTLMALHSLRCFSAEKHDFGGLDTHHRRMMRALFAFFDCFAGRRGRFGLIVFAKGGKTDFRPQLPSQDGPYGSNLPALWPALSVHDPSATVESSTSEGHMGAELVPRISAATQLLYASELVRAQRLSATALASMHQANCGDLGGTLAFQELLAERLPLACNTLPTEVSACTDMAAVFIRNGLLDLGIIRKILPRPGWTAAFLHRRDAQSDVWVSLCSVDSQTGLLASACRSDTEVRFSPCDFVRLIPLAPHHASGPRSLPRGELQQWNELLRILAEANVAPQGARPCRAHARRLGAKGRDKMCVAPVMRV